MNDLVRIKSAQLGYAVLHKLINQGQRNSVFPFDGNFTKEELYSIESLKLDSVNGHEELYKLKNLKALVVQGAENGLYLNLSSLEKLETLGVYNCKNLRVLNLDNLKKLQKLYVINNGIKEISGLEEITTLDEVMICGNKVKSVNDVRKYMINTRDAKINILDVIMYEPKMGDDLYKVFGTNISFGEMTNFDNHCFYLTLKEMEQIYKKAQVILSSLCLTNDSGMRKTRKIYQYLYKTIEYDRETLDYRNKRYMEVYNGNQLTKEELRMLLIINSSYGAIMNNFAVCDGYVNLMRLLLSMCDIESEKVDCRIRNNENGLDSHAAIKVKLNNRWYYADPQKEQANLDDTFFALDEKSFKKTHEIRDKYNK